MKKQILFISLSVLFSVLAKSQTNTFPSSGNVGIGTTSPIATLQVNTTAGGVVFQGANIGMEFHDEGNSNNFQLGLATSVGGYSRFAHVGDFILSKVNHPGNLYISNVQNGSINFTTGTSGTTDKIIMTVVGSNVGIGTTSPSSQLEVVGKITASGSGSTSGSFEADNIQNGNAYFTTNTISGNGFANINTLAGTTTVSLNSSGKSYFNGGNVLIGKTSQTNTGYLLDVAGNVRANKLVVNTTGADYVFDSSYKLPSLEEVEAFIQQNHHLSKISSASDMQRDGVDLGENQKMLLQKTEELTLYIIQQNKTINQQSAQIESLESKMNKLELELLKDK